jgi:hypothetical protein
MKLENVVLTPIEELKENSVIVVNELYVDDNEKICSNKKVIDLYALISNTNLIIEQNKKLSDIILKISKQLTDVKQLNISEIFDRLDKIESTISENLLE